MDTPVNTLASTKCQVRKARRTVAAKRTLMPRHIRNIRCYLNQRSRLRNRALIDLAIDDKLSGGDLVQNKIGVMGGERCSKSSDERPGRGKLRVARATKRCARE